MDTPENFQLSLAMWKGAAKNTLVQGLNYHRPSRTFLGHQADNVAGQEYQDVVIRQNKAVDGSYLGAVTVKQGGHGSSIGTETVDDNTVALWFGSDVAGTSGYVKFDIGDTGVKPFTKMNLPEGDIEIDQANDQLILRNGNRYRLYTFSSVKKNKRRKVADFSIPSWGKRWQGMYLVAGKLFVHRDYETGGKSQADMFDLTIKLPYDSAKLILPVKTWSTSDMGDEAEGFHSLEGDDGKIAVYAMKRTGPANENRILEGTRLVMLPKLVPVIPDPDPEPETPTTPVVDKTIHGVDVSSWQAGWVPDSGDDFFGVKSTEGTTYKNPEAPAQLAAGRANGLHAMHYHFMWPGDAKNQAAYFVKNTDIQPGDLLVCDWEMTAGGHPSVEDAAEFQAEVKSLTKGLNLVGLYCNESDWLNTKVKALDFLWGAKYTKTQSFNSSQLKFWQYTRTPLDKNIGFFESRDALKAWATPVVVVEPEPESPTETPELPPVIVDPTPIENVGVWVVDPAKVSTVLLGRNTDGKIADQLSPGTTIGDGIAFVKNSVGRYALLTSRGYSYDKEYLFQIGAATAIRPFPVIPDYDKEENITFRGRKTCRCVAVALPWLEYRLLQAGLIKYNIDIYQLGYSNAVAASAGTHAKGGCVDIGQFSDAQLAIERAMGWTFQRRTVAQGFSGNHGHGWPNGCPHLSPDAKKQQVSWNNGRDGLRQNKAITGPGPKGASTPKWDAALAAYMKTVANN